MTTNIHNLLHALDQKGVRVHADRGELVVRAARGAIDPALVDSLKHNKRELVAVLERRQHEAPARITPEMVTLVALSQDAIDAAVATVDGGAANVEDIYPLAPLQHGFLFHHLLQPVGDPYLLCNLLGFASKQRLDRFAAALQQVVDRHDILRTGFAWDGLDQPVQVVRRRATLALDIVDVDPERDVAQQLADRFAPRHHRIDIRRAPLLELHAAEDRGHRRWVLHVLIHHLISDHTTLERILDEARAIERGQLAQLPAPVPFRNFVAQATLGVSQAEHEAMFRRMLGDIEAPTAPFGVLDVLVDEAQLAEARQQVEPALAAAIRSCARTLRVSAASVIHLAWALVLARTTGRRDVVFGTLLFGRTQSGDRALGLFINTLPIRITIAGDGVVQALRATHARLVELIHHEHAPLVVAQRCSAVPSQLPLFTSLLNYRYSDHARRPGEALQLGDGIELLGGGERTTYPVSLDVDDLGADFVLTAQVHGSIDPARICALMVQALDALVHAVDGAPEQAVEQLEVVPAAERARLAGWAIQATAPRREQCVHELFEAQAAAQPEAIAVIQGEHRIGYGELDRQANRLANLLRLLGVRPDARVALYGPRCPEILVAMLGVLKAGGAYVPLDPSYPAQRLIEILDDSAPVVVVHLGALPDEVADRLSDVQRVDLERDATRWQVQSDRDVPRAAIGLAPHHLAYVIYTSGSTGRPKGVMVEHRAVVNQVAMLGEQVGLAPGVRMLQFASLAFDASVEELFASWARGATLVLRTDAWLAGAREFWALCGEHGVNVVDLPTQFWAQLADHPEPIPACVRWVIIGGEAVSEPAVSAWFAAGSPRPRLLNTYGPTEATVSATLFELTGRDGDARTIGRPSAGVAVHIVDDRMRPAPIGVAGEIAIGGVQVARGYLNRPELTAERFVDDPFAPGGRLYRTGDLGRWRADGAIEYLGRNDLQVKIRGFRIELGEIEATLAQVPGVREVVVAAREDVPGDQRLVAYVVGEPDGAELRAHAARRLPAHMVPSAYVALAALPVTASGKLDRVALPAPDAAAYPHRAYEPPRDDRERQLAEIWAELLRVERIGRHDRFFELGGHSLLAIQLVSRLRKAFGVELALGELFAHPELAALAARLDGAARSQLSPIPIVDRSRPLALSPAQQRLWFLTQLEGASLAYHTGDGVRLTGALDPGVLRRALVRIVERHEALRTCFPLVDGQPVQQVLSVPAARDALVFDERDLRAERSALAALAALLRDHAQAPFDLSRALPIRALVVRTADDEHVLHVTLHHIASDAWSMDVLLAELSQLYRAFLAGDPDPLPPLAVQYADYAAWQRDHLAGSALAAQSAFWHHNLAGAPGLLELPSDRPRPAQQDHSGDNLEVAVPAALSEQLRALGRRHGVTPYMAVLASWAAALGRLANQDEVVIGGPVAGRDRPETEPLIGFFINTLALRIDLRGDPTVAELLARTRAQVVAAQAHQDLPFDQVVEVVNPPRSLSHSPLFQVMLGWQTAADGALAMPGLAVTGLDTAQPTAQFDLALTLRDDGTHGLTGILNYATALFDRATVVRYVRYWQTLLAAMAADPDGTVHRLALQDPAERAQVMVAWNATALDYPRDRCIHELVEAQAAARPDAVAVAQDDHQLRYRELDARASQLARHLRSLGVAPDRRVAICAERSLELVIAMLAIAKAGGAYVPIDPGYPAERVARMLRDSAPVAVLTQAEVWARLAAIDPGDAPVIDLADDAAWRHQPTGELARGPVTARHLAYVLYTSGSTGTPKGVMIEHHSLHNLVAWHVAAFGLGPRTRSSSTAGVGFDATTWEIWPPLCSGGTLVLPPRAAAGDAEALLAWWHDQALDVSFLVTPLAELAHATGRANPRLTTLLVGGDRLRRWPDALPDGQALVNNYGPTETTVVATSGRLVRGDAVLHIGKPIANTRVYVLSPHRQPAPIGVTGELYIAGAGVARGYLDRPELTAERFVDDPFWPGQRMYRTGDLARWRRDGTIEYLGRNDFQVKIRGFRIELGEIEAALAQVPGVRDVVVVAREDVPGDPRLVAYYTEADAEAGEPDPYDILGRDVPDDPAVDAEALRQHAAHGLPPYMVPSAYVRLAALPLTQDGKIDRRALVAPDGASCEHGAYEAPEGELEHALAQIWREVLQVERVGRHDNFFEVGGHSLLVVQLIERMRRAGLHADVSALFTAPTLAELAAAITRVSDELAVPPNLIPDGAQRIAPDMLTLVALDQAAIDAIVAGVEGGAANVQDIYPLAPLQEGMLFHHLMQPASDPYLGRSLFGFASKAGLDHFLALLQRVIDRHDILRTAFAWDGLDQPVQVVWRRATLPVEILALDPADGDTVAQLEARFDLRAQWLDIRRAPLVRCAAAHDPARDRWVLCVLSHHLVDDNATFKLLVEDARAIDAGRLDQLAPVVPFRNFVARARSGVSAADHEAYFTRLLGDIREPTAPFGLLDTRGDGGALTEAQRALPPALSQAIRGCARQLGASAASLIHLAWALVLARTTGRRDVVFGTVLLGRMGGAQSDRVLGPSINTLPIRITVDDEAAEPAVKRTHAVLAQLLRHEHAPLVLAQRCSGVPAQTPLFTSLLNCRHSEEMATERAGLVDDIEMLGGQERSNFPVMLSVDDLGHGFLLTAQASAPIEPARVCDLMQTALDQLVQALAGAPGTPIDQIDVLPAAEREQLLVAWNATALDYPRDRCIHELVEAQAAARPDAVAVAQGDHQLRYRELDARACQLARHLQSLGVAPDRRVAICAERSLELVIAMLAIAKAGGAYVPIDLSGGGLSAERIAMMLRDCAPVVILTQADVWARLAAIDPGDVPVIDLADDAAWRHQPTGAVPRGPLTARHLAYVLYTSGSTGTPKGVMIEHHSLHNLVAWHIAAFGLGPRTRSSSTAGVGFDATTWEIWPPLCSGGTLVLPPRAAAGDAEALLAWWHDQALDVSFLVTPLAELAHATGRANPRLSTLLVGGDRLRRWPDALPDGQALVNNYGPTETTVVATSGRLVRGDAVLHIGKPIANTRVYVLDAERRPAPIGVAGELYIAGAGVARGYLDRPELTAERFVDDPFWPGQRMYRTGDLARWRADGTIEYLGRNDFQVKIRGFRIELGEIEAALAQVPGVRDVVVVAREDVPGDPRLVAYYTGDERADAAALRVHASHRLPASMVPSAYQRLDALPATSSGKIDRAALPAPDDAAGAARTDEAPQGELERQIAAIWAELLHVERIGRHDHFFDRGGHSLTAVQLRSRLRAGLGIELGLGELFQHPVLSELAGHVASAARSQLAPIRSVPRGAPLELSLAQQRLWFLTRLDGASEAYHIIGGVRLTGALDRGALQRALSRIVERHEALRTVFPLIDGRPMQLVRPHGGIEIAAHDVRDDAAPESAAQRLGRAHAERRFDLEHELPLRVQLVRISDDAHVLHVTIHHIAADGWSVSVLLDELGRLYRADLAGEPDPLPPLAVQYADYAAWQRDWLTGEELDRQQAFWRANLAGAPAVLELPADRPRPAQQAHAGAGIDLALSPALTAQLRALGQRHGVTLYMTMLASWAAVLGRLAGQGEVVIGSPAAGRNRPEIEPLIGFFVNTLALRVDLQGDPTVADLLARTRAQVLAAQAHQDLPFDQVVEAVQPPRSLAHPPVFQVMLDWHNTPAVRLDLPGLALAAVDPELTTAQFDLSLVLAERDDRIAGTLNYATALFDRETAERFVGYWQHLLAAMVADDPVAARPVDQLCMVPEPERRTLVFGWNATDRDHGPERFVHERIERHARQRPAQIAVDDGVTQLSYRELDQRANQLAHYLRAQGVVPDARVALCAPRGAAMVVGLVAILKSGGAYVPLDVAYPDDRIAHMLRDSAPVVVLTVGAEARERTVAHAVAAQRFDLETDRDRWADQPVHAPAAAGLLPSHLAYVIYTSGSTGAPKGAMIEHASLLNYTREAERWFELGRDDVVLQQNSLNFDLSLEEILPALAAGARLVPRAQLFGTPAGDPRPTLVHLTAAHWHSLVGQWSETGGHPAALAGVRMINVTGDAVSPHKLAQWDALCGDTRLINTYGPTEATVSCSAAYVRHEPGASRVSIGTPFANTRMYVLDRHRAPAPIGVAGELYISGAGVGRGYLNQPERTAERFVADPFWPGHRMYRTGDVVRWRRDGQLEFIGRDDQQVKLRGFRVELAEVEAALAQHAGVRDVVAIAREDAPGDRRLVAYYTGEHAPDGDALRRHAGQRLPAYMVPSACVHLAALPLTPGGKLDRAALPAPHPGDAASRGYEPPQGEIEHAIARIWEELLGLDRVGRHDDFFELGGHSLLAIHLIERMRRDGLALDVTTLFLSPTPAQLAAAIGHVEEIVL